LTQRRVGSTIDVCCREVARDGISFRPLTARTRSFAMPDPPKPTSEFAVEQSNAHALAGTVMLPSPFPAAARIYVGIKPRNDAASVERFYLKIVEVASDHHVVTRLLNLDDLRALRLRPEPGGYSDLKQWTLRTTDDLVKELDDVKAALRKAASGDLGAHEVSLFPAVPVPAPGVASARAVQPAQATVEREGIIHVHEAAPVLVRVEYGAVAAEAVVCAIGPARSNTCCGDKPLIPLSQ
jgi:hypothetical protein